MRGAIEVPPTMEARMSAFGRELRRALRRLRRSPGFTVIAVTCLAIGIGSATTVFGVINGLFVRPIPGVEGQDRLVTIEAAPSSYPNFRDLRDAATSFTTLAAFRDQLMSVSADGEPEQLLGLSVSGDYFRALGTRPAAGRLIGPDDDGPGLAPVAVLSHRLWRTRLGADPRVIGRTIRLNGSPVNVIGIAPAGFVGVFRGFQFDVWVPMAAAAEIASGPDLDARGEGRLQLVGRLRDGLERDAASSEVAAIRDRLASAYPEANQEIELSVIPYTGFDPDLRAGARALVTVLSAVAGLILLIACINVANMLLARSASRSRETAIRLALGGRRSAITALSISEGLILAGLAAVVGLILGEWASGRLRALVASFPVRLALDIGVDPRVAGFTVAIALFAGLAAAAAPAWQTTRANLAATLKTAGRSVSSRSRLGRGLVVGQVALSAVLLLSAGLLLRTLWAATEADPGFDIETVHVAPFIDVSSLGLEADEATSLYDRIRERVGALPGVESVSLVGNVPLFFTGRSTTNVDIEGIEPEAGQPGIEVGFTAIAPDYFRTMGIPLRLGRDFDSRDADKAPRVVIVNETAARRFWPNQEAIGETLQRGDLELRVIGVVADSRTTALEQAVPPFLYLPHTQSPDLRMNLVIRPTPGAGDPGTAVRGAFREIDPDLAPPRVQPLTDLLALSLLPQRVAAGVGGVLGIIAVVLAGLGIFGVISFSVSRRVREMGIRQALGADRERVLRLVVREGIVVALLGLAVGLPLALAGSRLLQGLLFGVSAVDPATHLTVALILLAAAALGSGFPAWRASRTDPMVALREE